MSEVFVNRPLWPAIMQTVKDFFGSLFYLYAKALLMYVILLP
jgi:hypothetical protein